MKAVKYINPEGLEVEVPEADADHFDSIGWPRADEDKAGKKSEKSKK